MVQKYVRILADVIEERVEKRVEERTKEATDKAMAQGMAQGMAKGKAQELIASVDNVVKNLKLSLEQGCIAVGTTLEGYAKAQELLKEAKKTAHRAFFFFTL